VPTLGSTNKALEGSHLFHWTRGYSNYD